MKAPKVERTVRRGPPDSVYPDMDWYSVVRVDGKDVSKCPLAHTKRAAQLCADGQIVAGVPKVPR